MIVEKLKLAAYLFAIAIAMAFLVLCCGVQYQRKAVETIRDGCEEFLRKSA